VLFALRSSGRDVRIVACVSTTLIDEEELVVHGFVRLVAAEGLAGLEVVECSPPYDSADLTSLVGVRVICDVLATLVLNDHLPRKRAG